MRILHLVSYSLYSGPMPGTLRLALAQQGLGHEVWLAYDTKRGAFNDYEEAAKPEVDASKISGVPLTLSAKSTPGEFMRDLLTLRRFIVEQRVDVVHCHLSHDYMVALLVLATLKKKPKLVRTLHSQRPLLRGGIERVALRQADSLIVRSHADRLLGESLGLRCHAIPGSIDTSRFKPSSPVAKQEARRRFQLPPDAFVIGHCALIANRGQQELLRAVMAVPEAGRPHILYVGRGEGEPALRAEVAELKAGPWVHFAGYLQGPALLEGYAAMDAAFVGRLGNDASGRSVLEAMACELPVVVWSHGALVELATIERAYPIDSLASPTLSSALADLLVDPSRLARAQAARRYVVEERSATSEAQKTIEALQP